MRLAPGRILLLVEQRDWLAAARLPRLLRKAGFVVDLYSRPDCIATASRHVDRRFHGHGDEREYFAGLEQLLADHPGEWCWVLPATDVDVRGLAIRARETWAAAILPARPSRDVVQALLSKAAMDALLRRAGVPVPRSRTVESPEEIVAFLEEVGGPVMLKPTDGVAGGGVVLVEGSAAAEDAFLAVARDHPSVMVQEFVRGRIGFCQAVFDAGERLAWMTAWKSRTWPGPFGPSSQVRFANVPSIVAHLEAIGEALGFRGLMSVDFIEREGTGEAVVIEVNPRPVGLMTRSHLAGVDLSAAVRALVLGETIRSHVGGTRKEATLQLFPQHLVQSLTERSLAGLALSFSPAALADVPWQDPRLLGAQLRHVLRAVADS